MKLLSVITISAMSLMLLATPQISQAKEPQGKSDSRHVVVGGNNSHKGNKASNRGMRYHNGHKSHGYKHYKHKKHYGHHHRRYRNKHGSWGSFVLGAAIGHSIGIHGSWYRGHPWCPSHRLYHTHSHYYHHDHHTYHDYNRKVASYIELGENGKCYRVSEYSNGDERKKRIRDYHCADLELEEWDEWEDLE